LDWFGRNDMQAVGQEIVKPFQHTFTVDEEMRTLHFAHLTSSKFKMFRDIKEAINSLGVDGGFGSIKNLYKTFTNTYGITPSNFKRVYNAKMLSMWVDPVKEHVQRFAYNSRRKVNDYIVHDIWKHKDLIDQAVLDGQHNLIPFIIHTGKNPEQLKQMYGKSVWKQICKNSMTRNKLIIGSNRFWKSTEHRDDSLVILSLPSYILKRGGNSVLSWDNSAQWLIDNRLINHKTNNMSHASRWQNTYRDTKRMSTQVGKPFSHSWTPDKLKAKHKEFTKLINLKKYSPEPFPLLSSFKVKQLEYKGYTATLLDSPFLIRNEGEVMHHCVGGYSEAVAQGRYLVYAVTKDGEKTSTIGINIATVVDPSRLLTNIKGKYSFRQHYGHCNKHIECPDEKEIAKRVIKQLNKEK